MECSSFPRSLWIFFWATIIYYDCSSKLVCYYGSSEIVYPGEGHGAYTHTATAIYTAVIVSHFVHCFKLVCWTESCRSNFHTLFYLSKPVCKVRKQGSYLQGWRGQSICRNTGLREKLGISEGTCVSKEGGVSKVENSSEHPDAQENRKKTECMLRLLSFINE